MSKIALVQVGDIVAEPDILAGQRGTRNFQEFVLSVIGWGSRDVSNRGNKPWTTQ
jgi:hypothetical protein